MHFLGKTLLDYSSLRAFVYSSSVYSCLENPMISMKRQKDRIVKDELPRSVGAQYAAGDQWRNNSRKNEEMKPSENNVQLWM